MPLPQIMTIFSDRQRRRRTTIAIDGLTDRQLKDIGVTRHDLFHARPHR
jgi:uncharacterized protein YjiS (DUF1127 family)